MTTYLIF